MTPGLEALPLSFLAARLLAVFVFYAALRHLRFSGWLALAVSSTLLYTFSALQNHPEWGVGVPITDGLAESIGILAIAMLLFVIGSPNTAWTWAGLTLVVFVAYQIRPSYLYLVGLTDPKHLGRLDLAHRVTLAQSVVDADPHLALLGRTFTAHGCSSWTTIFE